MTISSEPQGGKITIVVPTLDVRLGERTGLSALVTAMCSVPLDLEVVHDVNRDGFTKTVNRGIARADPRSDICLLNDDVFSFQACWLEILRKVLYSSTVFGLAGPSGASAAAPLNTGRLGDQGIQVVSQISFWCVLIKREMLNALGLLDEAFIHYCSDNWYCYLMHKAGWKCVWVRSVFLGHRRHGSGLHSKWRDHDRKILFSRIK